jgi:hypothetical protein
LGIVDLSSLTWEQFWVGVLYFMFCGGLFSLGIIRLLQQRIRAGVILLLSSVVSAVVIFSFIYNSYLGG